MRSALPPVGVGQTVPPPMRVTPADPYVETVRRFDRGVFFKPREPVPAGIPPELAPLIVHEVFDDDVSGNAAHRFGAVYVDPAGAAAVDVERPTMYVDETSIAIHGQPHDEMLFVWWYAVPPRGTTAQGRPKSCRPAGRGVRVTMGLDGFPMMWEVLSTGTVGDAERRSRVVFVSRGLEDAARDAFGPPLDGRRFSVEPSAAAHPDVMVAGVLEDGPVPMGPTVYVAAETHGITAVICRCMPARVDVLVASVVYDLVPLEWLVAAGLDVLLGVDAATLAPPGRARGPVAGCLRVPEGF
ncbi:MAG: hypothetical protein ACE5E6_10155 [Phycisphaerae bacterium]